MELLYINGDHGSVFESQVLSLLEKLKSFTEIDRVILLSGYRSEAEKLRIERMTCKSDIEIKLFKIYANYRLFNLFNRISVRKNIPKVLSKEKMIVHIRGETIAMLSVVPLLASKIPISNILVDIRGASLEETIEYSSLHCIKKILKIRNLRVSIATLKRYRNLNVVSTALKDYIFFKTKASFENVFIIPCLAGQLFRYNPVHRNELRNSLNIKEGEIVLVFSSGGIALWQDNQAIINIAEKGYKVLNLSKNNIVHPNVLNVFIPYNEVPKYLSAADIALMIRDKSIVNKVASPVKFSEFVCSGLPVVTNGNVDAINDYIQSTGHGLIIKDTCDLNRSNIEMLRAISREEISQTGHSIYSVEKIAQCYLSGYLKMSENKN
jgi:hypothetical protein